MKKPMRFFIDRLNIFVKLCKIKLMFEFKSKIGLSERNIRISNSF